MYGWTDIQNFFSFYKTLFPVGATAQKCHELTFQEKLRKFKESLRDRVPFQDALSRFKEHLKEGFNLCGLVKTNKKSKDFEMHQV